MILSKQIERYQVFISEGQRPATVKQTMLMLRALLVEGVSGAPKILARDAERLSPYTVRDRTAALRSFGKWAGIESLAKLKKPRAGGSHKQRAVFTTDEIMRLASCIEIPVERRLFYRMMYRAGLRVQEALSVTRASIRKSGKGWQIVLPQSVQKAGRQDSIPIPEELAGALIRNAPTKAGGWQPHVGTRFTIGRKFDRDLKAAGLEVCQGDAHRTPYDLRSFFVTELLRKGVPIPAVQKLARHADPTTTLKHYARMQEEEAAELGADAMEGL